MVVLEVGGTTKAQTATVGGAILNDFASDNERKKGIR